MANFKASRIFRRAPFNPSVQGIRRSKHPRPRPESRSPRNRNKGLDLSNLRGKGFDWVRFWVQEHLAGSCGAGSVLVGCRISVVGPPATETPPSPTLTGELARCQGFDRPSRALVSVWPRL